VQKKNAITSGFQYDVVSDDACEREKINVFILSFLSHLRGHYFVIRLQQSMESLPSEEPVTSIRHMDNVESAPPTDMDGAPAGHPAYQVQVRRLNINVKSPAVR
jgi:hypothetical protein